MPNKDQLIAVGSTCSEFDPGTGAAASTAMDAEASCELCRHWFGEEEKCQLDIFWSQLTSLDQE